MAKTKDPKPLAPEAYDWRGVEHWRCPVCGRDSGNETVIAEHIAEAHVARPHPLAGVTSAEETHGAAATDENGV